MKNSKQGWRRTLTAVAVATAIGLSGGAAWASGESTGNIVGTISAPVAGSYTVKIVNKETGLQRSAQVDSGSEYRFPRLPVGRYTVTVSDASGRVAAESEIVVAISSTANASFDLASRGGAEVIEVVGARPSAIDLTSVDSGLIVGEAEFDKLPVGRNATSIALLAPSTTQGDPDFGNLAAFAGASVAENAYYINGLNVTNFRNGLGGSTVPFEFYKEFQVKVGGYSAEFGRSLGGVINAVTKSGTNEFHAGANMFYSPDSLREDSPNSYYRNGRIYTPNDKDTADRMEANIWASGALIQDKLFYYVLFNPRNVETDNLGENGLNLYRNQDESSFWGAKVDWYISDDHSLELTWWSDEQETEQQVYAYNHTTQTRGRYYGVGVLENGGTNKALKYTGVMTDTLTISAMVGENEYTNSAYPSNAACPAVVDRRVNAPNGLNPGCDVPTFGVTTEGDYDHREMMRLDFEWAFADAHVLRFGIDSEEMTSYARSDRVGPLGQLPPDWLQYHNEFSGRAGVTQGAYSYTMRTWAPGQTLAMGGQTVVNETGAPIDYADVRLRNLGGEFVTDATAFYVEDQWQVSDSIFMSLGLRNENFSNKNYKGQTFADQKDQWAPRIGMTWDVMGDGKSKLFLNLGRYHLPIANNTSARAAGNEIYLIGYFPVLSTAPGTFLPQLDLNHQIGGTVVAGSGIINDPAIIADKDLKPMYQDEYMLGFQRELESGWSVGIKGIMRDVGSTIDDYCDLPQGCSLFNPGEDLTYWADENGNGRRDNDEHYVTLTAEEMGMPKAHREYHAIELTADRRTKDYTLSASYVWARSFGNFEGWVKSDIDQTDAGVTQDFDFAALMDGAEGYLPNDRRHTIKLFGAVNVTDDFQFGFNFLLQSGRPINGFGQGHPEFGTMPWGDSFYQTIRNADGTVSYVRTPRGHFGRTPWVAQLDLSARYSMSFGGTDVTLLADVFNLFNSDAVTGVFEASDVDNSPGTQDARFLLPNRWQQPRSVRVGAEVRF